MCSSAAAAAAVVKQRCGREYGFSGGEKLRATDLSILSASDLERLPLIMYPQKGTFHNLIEKPK